MTLWTLVRQSYCLLELFLSGSISMQPKTRAMTLTEPSNFLGTWLAGSRVTVALRASLTQRHCRLLPLHLRQPDQTCHRRLPLTMSSPPSTTPRLIVRIRLRSTRESALTHDSVFQVQVLCRQYQRFQTRLSPMLISETICKLQWRALAYSSS